MAVLPAGERLAASSVEGSVTLFTSRFSVRWRDRDRGVVGTCARLIGDKLRGRFYVLRIISALRELECVKINKSPLRPPPSSPLLPAPCRLWR